MILHWWHHHHRHRLRHLLNRLRLLHSFETHYHDLVIRYFPIFEKKMNFNIIMFRYDTGSRCRYIACFERGFCFAKFLFVCLFEFTFRCLLFVFVVVGIVAFSNSSAFGYLSKENIKIIGFVSKQHMKDKDHRRDADVDAIERRRWRWRCKRSR